MRALSVLSVLPLLSVPAVSYATPTDTKEPYLAIRTGLKCSACHTNVTGGGNRSQFGSIYAQTQLPARPGTVVSKAVAEFLNVGFDLRMEGSGTVEASDPRTRFALDVAQVYLEARFLNEQLTLYIDQTVGPNNAVSREAFALVRAGSGYAKVGKFLLPYGLRLQDDDEFIRSFTGFSYFTPDQGVEVGFEPGPLQFAVAVTNGEVGTQETNSGKQVTSSAALVFRNLRLGGSASRDHAPDGLRDVMGGFGGLSIGPIVLLGEVDYIREDPDAAAQVEQLAAYVEADVLAARGVNLKATFGYFDPDLEFDSGTQRRSRFGLEVFPVPFVRLAGFYTLLDFDQGGNDRDRVSVEAQVHF